MFSLSEMEFQKILTGMLPESWELPGSSLEAPLVSLPYIGGTHSSALGRVTSDRPEAARKRWI